MSLPNGNRLFANMDMHWKYFLFEQTHVISDQDRVIVGKKHIIFQQGHVTSEQKLVMFERGHVVFQQNHAMFGWKNSFPRRNI